MASDFLEWYSHLEAQLFHDYDVYCSGAYKSDFIIVLQLNYGTHLGIKWHDDLLGHCPYFDRYF